MVEQHLLEGPLREEMRIPQIAHPACPQVLRQNACVDQSGPAVVQKQPDMPVNLVMMMTQRWLHEPSNYIRAASDIVSQSVLVQHVRIVQSQHHANLLCARATELVVNGMILV